MLPETRLLTSQTLSLGLIEARPRRSSPSGSTRTSQTLSLGLIEAKSRAEIIPPGQLTSQTLSLGLIEAGIPAARCRPPCELPRR